MWSNHPRQVQGRPIHVREPHSHRQQDQSFPRPDLRSDFQNRSQESPADQRARSVLYF